MFNAECLWWAHEILHRSVLLDYQARIQIFSKERDGLEKSMDPGRAEGSFTPAP
jgi:hypothetical protein